MAPLWIGLEIRSTFWDVTTAPRAKGEPHVA